MNVKEYISSGIIESYVLGLASDEERREFESYSAQYPEIAEARDRFEQQLEEQLLADAPAPPVALKARVKAALQAERIVPVDGDGFAHEAPVRRMNPWKWAAAASVLVAAGSLFWAAQLRQQNQDLQASVRNGQETQQQLTEARARLADLQDQANTLRNPAVKMASLNGTPKAPKSQVMVFWDSTSRDVYMMVKNLPRPASTEQYQLWALLNGKPVDLGVFDFRQEQLLIKMKGVQAAQAFAITLEPHGGSVNPTLEKMYVYGDL
ncbi:anti-sigma factor [Flaviaesturariibacter amylovorans]|uniref:Anti-sigma K factor RskA C-terminal domain-containing protein n=1 Tax=Flaviaesturariibacter amylovorans TaxID=1084520 RepID=A0ABP8GA20_9BACT